MAHWQNQGNRPHPNPATARFTELLENLKHEFQTQHDRAEHHDGQLANQVAEMESIRRKLWDLEQASMSKMKGYEQTIAELRDALEKRGPHHMGGPSHSHPPPPQVGHGSSNHFGGIMAGGGGQGGPGLAPPPPEPAQPQGLPAHLAQGPPGPPPGLPQVPYSGFPQQSSNGYNPQPPPPPTQSPGPGNRPPRGGRLGGPPGPATPQQNIAAPYPGSPHMPRPTPPPGQPHHGHHTGQPQPPGLPVGRPVGQPLNVGNCLGDLELDSLRPEHKVEGDDWYCVWNPNARQRYLNIELVQTLPHKSVVCCVRFNHDGRFVATGCNKVAQIFDVETGSLVATLQDNPANDDGDLYIRSVCFSPDGKFLATGAEDKVIRVWNIAEQRVEKSFSGHEQDIYSLDYARNGRLIASGSGDRTVRLWDLETNTQLLQLLIDDGVTTVAISPDNRFLAAGSLDKSVRVWDIGSGVMVERLEGEFGHKDSVYSVAFSPDGYKIVSGSLDKTIKMWDLTGPPNRPGSRAGRMIRTFEGHKDFVLSVALTPDHNWVLSGSKDRGVQFWDPHTGQAECMLQGHKNSVISVAPSPVVGGLFATGSGDLRARIWRYKRYEPPLGHRQQ